MKFYEPPQLLKTFTKNVIVGVELEANTSVLKCYLKHIFFSHYIFIHFQIIISYVNHL